jgi:hypothetical protein
MILLYSHKLDPITNAVLNDNDLKSKAIPISIQDFINKCEIYDTISDKQISINWNIPGELKITNNSDQIIINRFIGFPDDSFNDFHEDDREYARSEYAAYLNFSLNQLKNVVGKPSSYGLMGNQYPLNIQWEIAKSKGYTPPNYFWGSHKYLSGLNLNELIVTQSLSQYYNWKKNYSEKTYSADDEFFFYERPAGTPVLIYGCLEKKYHEYPSLSNVLSSEEVFEIYREAEKIALDFETSLYEMLLFYDQKNKSIKFGMINSMFQGVRDHRAFKNFLTQSLQLKEIA